MSVAEMRKERLDKWLAERGVAYKCSVCQKPEFVIGEIIAGTGRVAGHTWDARVGAQSPMLQVICNECGAITLFSTNLICGIEKLHPDPK